MIVDQVYCLLDGRSTAGRPRVIRYGDGAPVSIGVCMATDGGVQSILDCSLFVVSKGKSGQTIEALKDLFGTAGRNF